jgi:hypothetical protein
MHNEWVVDYRCTHHMANDVSLFTWLEEAKERKIYVADDFSLDVVGQGDVTYRHLSCAKSQCKFVVCFSIDIDK